MSSISVNTITDASGGATTSINGFTPSVSNMAGRNRIINGDMRIDQRNAGASVTPANGEYTLDRFKVLLSQASKFTAQQNAGSVTPPAGFSNYLGLTVGASANVTVGTSDYFNIWHRIEGFNVADLGWGASGAKPITLSFWVRSSVSGTFGGALQNGVQTRFYPFTYTISTTNTWEQISVTIAGDTTGTWHTANETGITVSLGLGNGSAWSGTAGAWVAQSGSVYPASATGATNWIETNGATFYITGVQLEEGSVATPFCPAGGGSYGAELALCQRYFVNTTQAACMSNINSQYVSVCTRLNPVPMRATPSVSVSGTYTFNPFFGGGLYTSSNAPYLQRNLNDNFIINFNMGASTGTTGFGEIYNATLSISAEL